MSTPTNMALSNSVTTCLSQPVHYAICKLGFEKKDSYDINNILSGNGEVCWQAITEHVCYLESDLNNETLSLAEELVKLSGFVLKTMLPFWIAALTAFKQSRLEENAEASTLILMLSEITSQLLQYIPQNCCSSDDPINSVLTERFLKSVLQYTENLVTYTSAEKNKWDEAMELTHNTLIKIRKVSDRKLMLMHLAT
ncbi:hypothetical protein WISP_101216 [Willisornis vidua]|uniref:Uncharacterized protein n=1 Tax=Willisornis vidua TaxID=1566151 RepID=A0ABQ9D3W8_9PASS|nr:hypothetical protein WISP_101216 [Willisornis vidua]